MKKNEEVYLNLTDIEHILKRPGMYIGSIENLTQERWVLLENTLPNEEDDKNTANTTNTMLDEYFNKQLVTYNAGIEHCIVELITNATDHAQRCNIKEGYEKVTEISIECTKDYFEIKNNGKGITIEKTKNQNQEEMWIPEMIFSKPRSGSNYDDNEKRTWGGLNGYGAKAVNIFAEKFEIELMTCGIKYEQIFSNNNMKKTEPIITKVLNTKSHKEDYVKIKFYPDFARFKIQSFESNDNMKIIKKRVYDAAATTSKKVKILYNGQNIIVKDFASYIKLYTRGNKVVLLEDPNPECKYSIGVAVNPFETSTQISFVNGIATEDGGKHVDTILNKISTEIKNVLSSAKGVKKDTLDIKPQFIKDNLIVFIKCLVINPEFDSQIKSKLKTNYSDFGFKFDDEIIKDFAAKVLKLGIKDSIIALAKANGLKQLDKSTTTSSNSRLNIPKLEDASKAGKEPEKCTLILTEGDSAMTMALRGISSFSKEARAYWGIFPLKGKVLNVRSATLKQLDSNEEIKNIAKILGLSLGDKSIKKLRYNKIMLMCDQDSVTGNTPVILRNIQTGLISIQNIEDLYNNNNNNNLLTNIFRKQYANVPDYEIYTEKGFTKIKHIMKHKVSKKIYNISSDSFNVDVTEDHSLLNTLGEKISPKELLFNYNNIKHTECVKLMESFPSLDLFNKESNISEDEMYIFGYFFQNGYLSNEEISFYFTDISTLNFTKSLLDIVYKDQTKFLRNDIINKNSLYSKFCLSIKKEDIGFKIIYDRFINYLFYKKDKEIKWIHDEIINTNYKKKINFYIGLSDGLNNKKSRKGEEEKINIFETPNKITSQCLYLLFRSLNMNVKISVEEDTTIFKETETDNLYNKKIIYKIQSTSSLCSHTLMKTNIPSSIKIKEIIGHDYTEVYDLETENHHFQAGIGQLIVHNTDGFHIKGLIMNYLTQYWPELVEKNFICSLLTPIVKVFIPNIEHPKKIIDFYNQDKFEEFKLQATDKYDFKYYKGLGTSDKEETIQIFSFLKQYEEFSKCKKQTNTNVIKNVEDIKNLINYTYISNKKSEDNNFLDLAFEKDKADDRKNWILESIKNPKEVNYDIKKVSIGNFIDKELCQFSIYDNIRSIPSIIDGLKVSQRKVLYGSLKKNICSLKKQTKVATLASYISEQTQYHHGEVSLHETIINMAHNFVGASNANILVPAGEFGSRREGGKDHSSPRYISTYLSPWVPIVYNEADSILLEYNYEDKFKVEPIKYVPILPMILINGSLGIGTGFSTNIPCYRPKDIINNIKLLMEGKKQKELYPWYRHFTGKIEKIDESSFISHGTFRRNNRLDFSITELPVGTWSDDYEEKVLKKKEDITYNFEGKINNITLDVFTLTEYSDDDLIKEFKLTSNINLTNMYGFDQNNHITKFINPYEIIRTFYSYRLKLYTLRKKFEEENILYSINFLKEKARFIDMIAKNIIIINPNVDVEELISKLDEFSFKKYKSINSKLTLEQFKIIINNNPEFTDILNSFNYLKNTSIPIEDEEENEEKEEGESYNYLLSLKISQQTKKEYNKLLKEIEQLENTYKIISITTPENMWLNDLQKLDQFEEFTM